MEKAVLKTKCVHRKDGTRVVPGRCTNDCPHTMLRGWMLGIPWAKVCLKYYFRKCYVVLIVVIFIY